MNTKKKEKVKEKVKECEHEFIYKKDDEGGLNDGGTYEIYECKKCGENIKVQLPD